MNNIKNKIAIFTLAFSILFGTSCSDVLDQAEKVGYTEDNYLISGFHHMQELGMQAYTNLRHFNGYSGGALLAAACDEADFAKQSAIQYFNLGAWGPYVNPDDVFGHYYKAIRQVNYFLDKSENFRYYAAIGQDTINFKKNYIVNCDKMLKLRAENRFLRAYFYFELIKRYGGVPIITTVLPASNNNLPQPKSFDDCVKFIVDELDAAQVDMIDFWVNYDVPGGIGSGRGGVPGSTDLSNLGRAEKVAAKALKLRVLLYAASPLFNESGDVNKWKAAAAAGNDFLTDPVMDPWRRLQSAYKDIFTPQFRPFNTTSRRGNNSGIIFTRPFEQNGNSFERANYPIGVNGGGQAATCPSHNLVEAYEMLNGFTFNPSNPYANRDPRLAATIGFNGANLGTDISGNYRPIEAFEGGADGIGSKYGATTTGYYLKKFTHDRLNLSQGQTAPKSWILMRYGEVLLNFAEAMNEAYGPDAKPVINGTPAFYSAVEAVNLIRRRASVNLPPIPTGLTKAQMRERIIHERRVELAFEEHRFFDVRRWKIAEVTENAPLLGVKAVRTVNPITQAVSFTYQTIEVEKRKFDAPKMYLYPIPFAEISKSNGVLKQNLNW